MVVGGDGAAQSAELYDPASELWMSMTSLDKWRGGSHTAVALPSGVVLVVGGEPQWALLFSRPELYDPGTLSWRPAAVTVGRRNHTATALQSGEVLVVGGEHWSYDAGASMFASAELYFPP
jgi:hypothetical protein